MNVEKEYGGSILPACGPEGICILLERNRHEGRVSIADREDSRALARFLSREGQALLPMLELIEVAGRATIEAVLTLSAQEVAGSKHPGKRVGVIGGHGRQNGVVCRAERKLRIRKPRLRQKGKGKHSEVETPAFAAMQTHSRIGERM